MQVADLARGTFGFVQLAEDLTTGEHLAIKVRLAPAPGLNTASYAVTCAIPAPSVTPSGLSGGSCLRAVCTPRREGMLRVNVVLGNAAPVVAL